MDHDQGTCRACKAPLVWVRSAAGDKPVPLNPPTYEGNVVKNTATERERAGRDGVRLVTGYTERGEVRTVRLEAPQVEGLGLVQAPRATVRTTHFADCPARAEFRRR